MKSIEILKTRLSVMNTLIVQQENGHLFDSGFEWNKPALDNEISEFEKTHEILLPEGYKSFLKISNGAILYKDNTYGQWGIRIFGLGEIAKKTSDFIRINSSVLNDMLTSSFLVFAEWLGDCDSFIFDLEKIKNNEKKYILYGEECENPADFRYLCCFEKFIDRIIVAQGAKYWTWC